MTTSTSAWQQNRLAYLRGLRSPSEHQRLLLVLTDKPEPTPSDAKKMAALWRAEQAADRAQRARVVASKIVRSDQEAERKARTRRLIEMGGLVAIADIDDWDRGTLLGAMLDIAAASPERHPSWKQKGDMVIAQRGSGEK